MMYLESAKTEYRRYKKLAEDAIQQVSDEELFKSKGPSGNSISIIVGHISGNLKSRFTNFLTTDGEKPWRNRDREFEEPGLNRDDLLGDWEDAWLMLFETLNGLSNGDLNTTVEIRGVALSAVEAINRSMSHVAYHVGQIVILARASAGSEWKFLSIPPGQSAQYNMNPTMEKEPSRSMQRTEEDPGR